MKKSIFIAWGLALLATFSSCDKKELDITLTEKSSGNVKIIVKNSNGSPIANQKVDIANYNDSFEDGLTDANGMVEFKDILMGNYYIKMTDVLENGVKYTVNQPVQVINSVTKEYTIVPSDYSGEFRLTVFNNNGEPLSGINVVAFKNEDIVGYNFTDFMDIAISQGTTDENGRITFNNLPLSLYGIMVYRTELNFVYETYFANIDRKNQKINGSFYYWQ